MVARNIAVGRQGEDLACRVLEDHLWRIVDRNWRVRQGEVDIVATKDGVAGFFEVKTRTSCKCGSGAEYISSIKRRRMRSVAAHWLSANAESFERVDLFTVEISADRSPVAIRFIRVVD